LTVAAMILCEDPAAETAGRQKTMDVTLWQKPQGVKKLSILKEVFATLARTLGNVRFYLLCALL
jgi:hypothetical protein